MVKYVLVPHLANRCLPITAKITHRSAHLKCDRKVGSAKDGRGANVTLQNLEWTEWNGSDWQRVLKIA